MVKATRIIDGYMVDEDTLRRVRGLRGSAARARAEMDAEEVAAKAILAKNGVVARVVVTDRAALLSHAADLADVEARELLEGCPRQAPTDETWSG